MGFYNTCVVKIIESSHASKIKTRVHGCGKNILWRSIGVMEENFFIIYRCGNVDCMGSLCFFSSCVALVFPMNSLCIPFVFPLYFPHVEKENKDMWACIPFLCCTCGIPLFLFLCIFPTCGVDNVKCNMVLCLWKEVKMWIIV